MADGAKNDIIGNIRIIDKVVKEKRPAIQTLISAYKKYIEDSLAALGERKASLIRIENERAERLIEQETVAREAEEAIRNKPETIEETPVKTADEATPAPEEEADAPAEAEESADAVQPQVRKEKDRKSVV